MSSLLLILLLSLAGRSLMLQRHAGRHALLARSRAGWWSVELRRRACVCHVPGDHQDFPQPREFRIRVWRIAGVPVWWRGAFVALPLQCDAVIGELGPEAFDGLFDPAWRLGAFAAVPAAAADARPRPASRQPA